MFSYDDIPNENPDDGRRRIELPKPGSRRSSSLASTVSSSVAAALIPLSVWHLAVSKALRKKHWTYNQANDIRDEANFNKEARYGHQNNDTYRDR